MFLRGSAVYMFTAPVAIIENPSCCHAAPPARGTVRNAFFLILQMLQWTISSWLMLINNDVVQAAAAGFDVDGRETSMMVTTATCFWLSLWSIFTKSRSSSCNITFVFGRRVLLLGRKLLIKNRTYSAERKFDAKCVNFPPSLVLNWEISPLNMFKILAQKNTDKNTFLGSQ